MPRTGPETGTLIYTGRAFQQDANEAMRGDVVRGLIELITNSDDAYLSHGPDARGKIGIEVEHRRSQPWKLIVRDRAKGMRAVEMKQKFVELGGRTSGFEAGLERRGNLGRGAKDLAAFGDVTFESVCDDRYSHFVLRKDGTWELDPERSARPEDRDLLGIPRGNGLVVTVDVMPNIRCPRHDTLRQKLSRHFQLRDILNDPHREIHLTNLNDGTRDRLIYQYPSLPAVFDADISVLGYPDAVPTHLVIWRLPERSDESSTDEGRTTGILIKGGRAIYENTLFGLEGNPHAGWFAGRLTCPYIDTLAREFDDRLQNGQVLTVANPVPIISRRRDGLASDHPFVIALKAAAEVPLRELVTAEAERARTDLDGSESQSTRNSLDRLADEVGRLLGEELREIEAEELPLGPEGLPPVLAIAPEQVIAYMGEIRTLTVVASANSSSLGDSIAVSADPGGVVELLTPEISLRAHGRRDDVLVGQVRVRPMLVGEVTIITVTLGDRTAQALVEVRPARVEIEEEILAPDSLMFERPSYQVGWLKRKPLKIFAPVEFVAENGSTLQISSSDPGIVVRGPTCELIFDDASHFYKGTVTIEARTLASRAVVRASAEGVIAETQVFVVRREEGPRVAIRILKEEMGFWRAISDNEPLESGGERMVIKILGRHPALRGYLGDNLEGQDSPVCRGMIAEIVADFTARHVVRELYRLRRGSEEFDADRFYREHYKRLTRFLPRFHRLLVGDGTAARTAEALSPSELLSG
jgi:hypothetical protein